MRLKHLKMKGFKSFADDTEVHFSDPIIGVVGPNGSGKSNIIDSIRWVLGEQKSKDLRLDKMTDVIFNGSKKRKQSGLAQVTLTFENTKNLIPIEFDEVAVTRILYSDASSEYRINDVKCRLKDIKDLFIDSGIGSNSYAIIELKMVDDILMDKDRARLKMFEQAAGISKYKARKQETLNKLRNTEADLDRVEDILFELDNSLKELKKQADRTRKFNEIKIDYKDKSILLAQKEIELTDNKRRSLEEKIQSEKDIYDSATAEKNTLDAEVENFKRTNLEKEKSLSATQEKFNLLIDDTRKKESEKSIVEQKIEFNSKTIQQNSGRINIIQNDLKQVNVDLENINKNIEVAQKAYDDHDAMTSGINEEYLRLKKERDESKDIMTMAQNQLLENQRQVHELETKLALNKSEIGSHESNILALQEQLQTINNNSKADLAEADELKTNLDKQTNLFAKNNEKLEELETKQKNLSVEKEGLEKSLIEINRKLDAKKNELELLKNMIDNMEGFPDSIKFVSEHWKKKIPLLQDLIDVQDKYKTAIEQYLDPYLNYFVAKDFKEAYSSVELLREGQKGKCQFFVLSEFKSSKTANVINGAIPAIDVLDFDKKYTQLFQHLFKDVFIATSKNDIASEVIPEGASLIASSGTILRSKYAIKGGSVGIFEGKKLGRAKSVEKLEKEIEALLKQQADLEKQLEKADETEIIAEIETLNKQKIEIDQQINMINIAVAQKDTALASFRSQSDEINERIVFSQAQITSQQGSLSGFENALSSLNQNISEQSNSETNTSDLFSRINQVYEESSARYNEHQIQLITLKSQLDRLNNEFTIKSEQQSSQDDRLENYTKEIAELKQGNQENEKQLDEIKTSLVTLYESKKADQKSLSNQEQSYFTEKQKIIEKEDIVKKLDRKLTDGQIKINELKNKLQNIEFSNQGIKERLHIEFNIDWKEINIDELTTDNDYPLEDLRTKVNRFRNRLENYGEINPMALEAYDEMNARYESTQAQKQDILDAKDSLLQTIEEIETSATKQFDQAFNQIRDNFKIVFRSLFTEDDDCDLVLLNPDNPLESQIEIIAKPKGKKPKVLKQLSGGEKTLTATALLFSLYLLKPAPFCIFDEVDAPLDDANISKFNKLIRKFSEDSQFIIVTHNKSTMAAVDVLYGVYLKEEGVSGLAPVDFRELEYV